MELPNRRYEGLHKPVVLSNEQFKVLKKYMNCDIFQHVKILQRIGSDSLYATVWLASLTTADFTFAVKVQKDIKKSEKEANMSYKLENWFEYFLLMYYNIRCDDIRLNGKSYSGMFMFMEVAMSDLRQLIKYQNVTKAELVSYILNVCDSVEIMASNFLFHGDLHIGNVFLVERDNINSRNANTQAIKAVVGDFGESSFVTSATSHLSDIGNFITSLSTEIKTMALNGLLANNKLVIVTKHINLQTAKTEAEYDRFLETNPSDIEQDEFIIHLVKRDMDVIKDLVQGIF